jgi:hypothetical protein
VPNDAIPRCHVTNTVFFVAHIVTGAIFNELVKDEGPLSAADDALVGQLAASAAVQHLLLIAVAFSCQQLYKQQQGMSHFQTKQATAAVTGARQWAAAAAAAAAEAAATSSSSSSSTRQQRQHLAVPALLCWIYCLCQKKA